VHHVTAHVLVLNGPNLNLLGTREPEVYGRDTLADIESELRALAQARGARVECFQTNHEGALIDRIHAARTEQVDMIVINAGAWTHTSIAVRDALAAVAIPYIEVHLTNVHGRESFRHRSLLADRAIGTIVGLGPAGYRYALQYALDRWSR
jgi:3-dehydroquinate dehydratase-2